jgi:hypothetical protein
VGADNAHSEIISVVASYPIPGFCSLWLDARRTNNAPWVSGGPAHAVADIYRFLQQRLKLEGMRGKKKKKSQKSHGRQPMEETVVGELKAVSGYTSDFRRTTANVDLSKVAPTPLAGFPLRTQLAKGSRRTGRLRLRRREGASGGSGAVLA